MKNSDMTWQDTMRRLLGIVEFHQPIDVKLGAKRTVEEVNSLSITGWSEHKAGSIQLFGFTKLLLWSFFDGEGDALFGDVETALSQLQDGPVSDAVEQIKAAGVWRSSFDVVRGALDALEHVQSYYGGGVGTIQRMEPILQRLEAEGLARQAEGVEGAAFIYGFAQLHTNHGHQKWKEKTHTALLIAKKGNPKD